jgi:WD40 repeat protein
MCCFLALAAVHSIAILPSHSLYMGHHCDWEDVPRITTAILKGHANEVWNLEWSHDGVFLASASKDRSVIIWRIGLNIFLVMLSLRLRAGALAYTNTCLVRTRITIKGAFNGTYTFRSSVPCQQYCMVVGRLHTSHKC